MELGPDQGTVKVRTGVAGSASRMGHRLVLNVEDWSAQVEVTDGVVVSVQFRADLETLHVESGRGGVTPLTVVDKQVIRRNAAKVLDVGTYPEVTFSSTEIEVTEDTVTVTGDLTIHDVTLPLTAELTRDGDHVTGSIPVVQSDFGIRPYSAMLGQLKVLDEVTVDLDITVLPAAQ
ncbi:MAG: YceI family protein [Candidatus Nanopelagicales bacterium]